MADTPALGAGAARHGGSSPLPGTCGIHVFQHPPVAQLVEQSPLKRTVLGSNPSGRTDSHARVAEWFTQRT